jgi:methanogenic corrinoid protein MtbC1
MVIGALESDAHDLGKNIFNMVLKAKDCRVVDCDKDCSLEKKALLMVSIIWIRSPG